MRLQRVLFDDLPGQVEPKKKKIVSISSSNKCQKVVPDLEISEPYFGVKKGEREDVVDERFSSPSLWRHAKYLCVPNIQSNDETGRKGMYVS